MSIYGDHHDGDEICEKGKAALIYAERGWPVFPLKPNGKEPMVKIGFKAATCDAGQITKWWTEHPNANLGIPTGSTSGFWVIDIDRKDGKDGLIQLLKTLTSVDKKSFKEALSLYLVQLTTTEGLHIPVQWSPDHPVRNRTNVIEGVDIRGEGGYIVVEPSSVDGREYKWNDLELPTVCYQPWMDQLLSIKRKVRQTANAFPRSNKRHEDTEHPPTSLLLREMFLTPPVLGERDDHFFRASNRMKPF